MTSMGQVWDRTTDVLRGRTSIIAPIAALAIFLPSVVNAALTSFRMAPSAATGFLTLAIALAVVVATMWGTLAIIAVATDPATTRADAGAQATARLLPAIGVVVALGVILSLAFVPVVITLIGSGATIGMPTATRLTTGNVSLSAGAATFVTLYTLLLIVGGLWLSARLMLLNPVILNERLGLRSIPRSIELTRGLTARLIGVLILFAIVVLVPTLAVQAVVGIVARLLLGAEGIPVAAFLAGVAGAAVTSGFSAVAAVFQAQLYVAVRDRA